MSFTANPRDQSRSPSPQIEDVIVNMASRQESLVSDSLVSQPQQPYDDDDHSGELREYDGKFEGPEKTLEVCFRQIQGHNLQCCDEGSQSSSGCDVSSLEGGGGGGGGDIPRVGLRTLSRPNLDRICARARCTILSQLSNKYLDAYVLSESSLFVYPYMIVLKTCGTTTLLRCVAVLIELGRGLGLEIDWVGYSRKNFNFPGDQAFPHGSFNQEMDYLHSHRALCERLNGNGYTLGPVTNDHWFVYVADHTARYSADLDTDRVLNIMMFDIDESVAKHFYYDSYPAKREDETEEEAVRRISEAQTKAAGINNLVPGATIDPRAFEPCGYSMNSVLFRSYSTMHITPESGSSYASFETNQKLRNYSSVVGDVVRAFRPRRFVSTLMADEGGLAEMGPNSLFTGGSLMAKVPATGGMMYKRTSLASIQVETDVCCMMGNWVLDDGPAASGGAENGAAVTDAVDEKRLRCESVCY